MQTASILKLEDVEKFMFLSGIQTYAILWRGIDKAGVRFNGMDVTLASADINAKLNP